MKSLMHLLLFILAALFFTSCEKVIDLEVRDADKKLVIEAVLTDQQGGCLVQLSRTHSLSANNNFEKLSGARVQISDDNGATVQLTETLPGQYRSELVGTPGHRYHLQVTVGQQSYTASSVMPAPVAIDSVFVTAMDMMGKTQYVTHVVFTDPAAVGNAYRLVQFRNGVKDKMFMVLQDDLSNGRQNTVSLYHNDSEGARGDRIAVRLESIGLPVYTYWYSLWQGSTGQGNAASPGNPVANITGGALGYFSAQAVTSFETAIQ